jgi:hypothetical protein
MERTPLSMLFLLVVGTVTGAGPDRWGVVAAGNTAGVGAALSDVMTGEPQHKLGQFPDVNVLTAAAKNTVRAVGKVDPDAQSLTKLLRTTGEGGRHHHHLGSAENVHSADDDDGMRDQTKKKAERTAVTNRAVTTPPGAFAGAAAGAAAAVPPSAGDLARIDELAKKAFNAGKKGDVKALDDNVATGVNKVAAAVKKADVEKLVGSSSFNTGKPVLEAALDKVGLGGSTTAALKSEKDLAKKLHQAAVTREAALTKEAHDVLDANKAKIEKRFHEIEKAGENAIFSKQAARVALPTLMMMQ